MAKVRNTSTTLSTKISGNQNKLDNYVTLVSDGTSCLNHSNIDIKNHMSTDKIAKLVNILTNNDEFKLKEIIKSDIDRELSEHLLKDLDFKFDFYLEMFSFYLGAFDPSKGWQADLNVFEIIISKASFKSQLKSLEEILWNSALALDFQSSCGEIQKKINEKRDKTPNSYDFIIEED